MPDKIEIHPGENLQAEIRKEDKDMKIKWAEEIGKDKNKITEIQMNGIEYSITKLWLIFFIDFVLFFKLSILLFL